MVQQYALPIHCIGLILTNVFAQNSNMYLFQYCNFNIAYLVFIHI